MNGEQQNQEEYALHMDNLRRFVAMERKVEENTVVTEKLATDVADLLTMWRDAGVVFKWLRRLGAGLVWLAKIATAIGALWAAWRYGVSPPQK